MRTISLVSLSIPFWNRKVINNSLFISKYKELCNAYPSTSYTNKERESWFEDNYNFLLTEYNTTIYTICKSFTWKSSISFLNLFWNYLLYGYSQNFIVKLSIEELDTLLNSFNQIKGIKVKIKEYNGEHYKDYWTKRKNEFYLQKYGNNEYLIIEKNTDTEIFIWEEWSFGLAQKYIVKKLLEVGVEIRE